MVIIQSKGVGLMIGYRLVFIFTLVLLALVRVVINYNSYALKYQGLQSKIFNSPMQQKKQKENVSLNISQSFQDLRQQRSGCTQSMLFCKPSATEYQVLRMQHQISQLSVIALRLGKQKMEHKEIQEQLKSAHQQVRFLQKQNDQLRQRNRQLYLQLQTNKLQTANYIDINQSLTNQIIRLERELQILKKQSASRVSDLSFKVQTLSKMCIKMAKQRFQHQEMKLKCQQLSQQLFIIQSQTKSQVLVLQWSKKEIEKLLKNKLATSERNYKQLQMKYKHKCKELEMANNQLIDCQARYLQAIQEMNKRMKVSQKQGHAKSQQTF